MISRIFIVLELFYFTKIMDNHFLLKTQKRKKYFLHNINIDENKHYININVDENTKNPQQTLNIILYAILIFIEIAFNQH